MNWGLKLALAMTAFVSFILYMVISSTSVHSDLESEDYYEKELAYQETIDAKSNTTKLKGSFEVDLRDDHVWVILPEDFKHTAKGSIHFFRPNNAAMDKVIEMNEKKHYAIPMDQFEKGTYKVQIQCKYMGKDYQYQQDILVP